MNCRRLRLVAEDSPSSTEPFMHPPAVPQVVDVCASEDVKVDNPLGFSLEPSKLWHGRSEATLE